MITVGKKATEFFKKRNYNLTKEFNQVFADLKFDIIEDVIEPVKYEFVNNDTDRVIVFYNEFVSVIKQDPKYIQLLPLDPDSLTDDKSENSNSGAKEYIYEPQQAEILDNLLPKLVDIRLWKTLLDSNAAEQAARMFAMDNATTNANELISHLNLVYNKERQASITTEMLEIVSGANALRDG
jgi:F-type H+-transporting ATPase subunit gamma